MSELEKLRIPATSSVGVAFGLTVAEFLAEFTARVSGQVQWKKVGVKALIKLIVGLIFYGIANKVGGLWSLGFELATYGSVGSIVPDVIFQIYPGGVTGVADKAAMKARVAFKGGNDISSKMTEYEKAQVATASHT